jgi:hypothetical protein
MLHRPPIILFPWSSLLPLSLPYHSLSLIRFPSFALRSLMHLVPECNRSLCPADSPLKMGCGASKGASGKQFFKPSLPCPVLSLSCPVFSQYQLHVPLQRMRLIERHAYHDFGRCSPFTTAVAFPATALTTGRPRSSPLPTSRLKCYPMSFLISTTGCLNTLRR